MSRVLPRMIRSASLRVVVASQDASRSGWRILPQCSAKRSHTVCTTSSVAAPPRRYDRATDQTRPANCWTIASHASWSPSTTRASSSSYPSTARESRPRLLRTATEDPPAGSSECAPVITWKREPIGRPDRDTRGARIAHAPSATNGAAVGSRGSPPATAARASGGATPAGERPVQLDHDADDPLVVDRRQRGDDVGHAQRHQRARQAEERAAPQRPRARRRCTPTARPCPAAARGPGGRGR